MDHDHGREVTSDRCPPVGAFRACWSSIANDDLRPARARRPPPRVTCPGFPGQGSTCPAIDVHGLVSSVLQDEIRVHGSKRALCASRCTKRLDSQGAPRRHVKTPEPFAAPRAMDTRTRLAL